LSPFLAPLSSEKSRRALGIRPKERPLREKPIVAPRRWRGVRSKRAVFVPFDLPSKVVRKLICARKPKETALGYARVFISPDQVVVYGAVGAPVTVICMEELIASGVREFLVLGVCGSLSEDYPIGTAVSITKALSEEGTSRAYFSKKRTFFPSPGLKLKVQARLTSQGLSYKPGVIVTTDAPYRETHAWLKRNQRRGAGLVDMEVSAVFAAAEHFGLKAAALLVVSDELFSGDWTTGFSHPKLEKSLTDHLSPFL
jgi:uridine phosphorylase